MKKWTSLEKEIRAKTTENLVLELEEIKEFLGEALDEMSAAEKKLQEMQYIYSSAIREQRIFESELTKREVINE